jgi:uncharacterized membrane protein
MVSRLRVLAGVVVVLVLEYAASALMGNRSIFWAVVVGVLLGVFLGQIVAAALRRPARPHPGNGCHD